jgi:LPPG:FO 2-phospho-L-lactate transferase
VKSVRVVALAGGTGSAKLLPGLSAESDDLTVIANVGDNYTVHGLLVCPDIDIAMYTLAGVADRKKGWGVEGDTFRTLAHLARIRQDTWFKLGDADLSTHIVRTEQVRQGRTLTQVTKALCEGWGAQESVLPSTDDPAETWVKTPSGSLHLQEFWVRFRGRPKVTGVEYRGAAKARPTKEVARAVSRADVIVICPGNPVTSIGPILAIGGMKRLLADSSARRVALTPMLGSAPFSGPAGKMMTAVGASPDSAGVAGLLAGVADSIYIDRADDGLRARVERSGVSCKLTDARIEGPKDSRRIAREMLRS